ncbi:methyltransferase family protein [Hydrogenimonas sp.]
MLAGGPALSIYFDLLYFKQLFLNPLYHLLTLPIGLFLAMLAFRAAAAGGKELARHGRQKRSTPRLETDSLVTTGIYSHMRHPMLFGLALLPLALACILGSPTFILVVAPLETLFVIVMVLTFEERECRKKFGAAYDDYARRVPAVCFKRECLMKLFSKKV